MLSRASTSSIARPSSAEEQRWSTSFPYGQDDSATHCLSLSGQLQAFRLFLLTREWQKHSPHAFFLHDGVVLLGASRWILTEHGFHVPIVRLAVSRHFGAGLVQYAVLKASSFFVHLFLLGLVEVRVCRTGFSTLHQR